MPEHEKDEMQEMISKYLIRAALKAREVAMRTNTPLVVTVDGELTHLWITEKDIEEFREQHKDAFL